MRPLALACLPDGYHPKQDGSRSSIRSSWHAHNTVLYAVPLIETKGHLKLGCIEVCDGT